MPVPVVELDALTHRYGQRLALDALTLRVDEGCIFGLLGPNGGGKTTLFRILTTQLTPESGSARVAGADVVREKEKVRSKIGIVFQHPSIDGKLTVLENAVHQGHLYGLSGGSLRSRSAELLGRFGLGDRLPDRAEKLSGGLQRRLELAKSLLHRPSVLILDEPSTGLDPVARAALMDCLRELAQRDRVTSLLTTHFMDEADRCDRIAILDRGRLVGHGVPSELRAAIGGDVITLACRNPDALAAEVRSKFAVEAQVVDGTVRIERRNGHELIPRIIEAFPGEIESVTVAKPALDDVFLHLAGHRWADSEPELAPTTVAKA